MMTTEKDYPAAADWAEHEMTLKPHSRTARRGAVAADYGREVVERASGGRPSIDPNAGPGQHARKRQVRLSAEIDQRLTALALAQQRSASAIMREALTDYFDGHRCRSRS